MKTLRRGLRAPDREKVKACSLECPSDIREDVCSVSRIPSSVSGCQGSAGGFPPRRPRERRKEILYRVSCWLSTTFFKIFENSFPTGTRSHWPRETSRRAFLKRGFSRIPLRLQERKGEFRKFFKRHLRHTCKLAQLASCPWHATRSPPSQQIESRRSQEFLSDRMSAL